AGIDKSERMIKLALTNMAMFGFPTAHLDLANSLLRHGQDNKITSRYINSAGLILTNPPFGAEFAAEHLKGYYISKTPEAGGGTINSEILFMERYLEWLRPGGQLLAIVPDSILTNKGIFDALRRQMRDVIEIRAVVSLPSVTFAASGTSTKTS